MCVCARGVRYELLVSGVELTVTTSMRENHPSDTRLSPKITSHFLNLGCHQPPRRVAMVHYRIHCTMCGIPRHVSSRWYVAIYLGRESRVATTTKNQVPSSLLTTGFKSFGDVVVDRSSF